MIPKLLAHKWFKIACAIFIIFISGIIIYLYFATPEHINVILITIDTLRADHLGCYGYKHNTSPFIDQIAHKGIIFSNVYAQIPLTLPSHTAILTGIHPKTNGVRLNGFCKAKDDLVSLAEILKDNSYSTFAIIGGFPLDNRFGLSQGFDTYDDDFIGDKKKKAKYWHHHKFHRYERKANEITDGAVGLLKKTSRWDKFFLWLHYFDPHWRYRPPEKFRKLFTLNYDGEIAFVDSEIERFFDFLMKERLVQNSLIIIVSDHGEGLNEHGEEGHGWELFNSTLRIPLIFYCPKIFPSAMRIDALSQSIDILPTILEILGIPDLNSVEGQSLLPFINEAQKKNNERFIFAESNKPKIVYGNLTRYAVIDGKLKLIAYYNADNEIVEYKLFNLEKDPEELVNIYDSNLEIAERFAFELKRFFLPASNNFTLFKANQEIFEKMKALGYID
jgi:arylsulfatase A-like enzyme